MLLGLWFVCIAAKVFKFSAVSQSGGLWFLCITLLIEIFPPIKIHVNNILLLYAGKWGKI